MKEIYKEVLKNTVLITGRFILLSLVSVIIIVTSVIGISPLLLGFYLIEECDYDILILIIPVNIFLYPCLAFGFIIAVTIVEKIAKIAKKIGIPFI